MNLPDHSGLGVLDQLKRNPQTRHIPVHVVSVADYSREALELGAVGYALKPVKREQLVEALAAARSEVLAAPAPGARRRGRRAPAREHRAAAGARGRRDRRRRHRGAKRSTQLQAATFDCMVMDLNLPDLSGYELLEQMAEQRRRLVPAGDRLHRPHADAATRSSGCAATRKSIIIKDARSPERLLDEVTLFLHQVESELPAERQRMLREARDREAALEGRRILVVEDDVRNIFALSSVLEPKGADGRDRAQRPRGARRARRSRRRSGPRHRPRADGHHDAGDGRPHRDARDPQAPRVAEAADHRAHRQGDADDQEKCLAAGANDYIAKPLDVEKLLSLVRVWMPK